METTRLDWIETLVGEALYKLLACTGHGDRNRHRGYNGVTVSDRAAVGVMVADRMLTALGRIPGCDSTGCDACSRDLPDLATEIAADDCYPLPYRHTSTQNEYGGDDCLSFCGFCQIDGWPDD